MSSKVSSISRLTGLASGMDTESIVANMMSKSKARIDKVKQQKTRLEWKQEYYKSTLTKLNSFQTKSFGTSDSNLKLSLSKLSATYSSPYVSVTPGSDAVKGNIYISDIVSLASSASVKSSNTVSSDPVISVNTGNLSELSGKSIDVTLDGIKKTLTFSEKTYLSSQDVVNELNSLLSASFGAGRVDLSLNNDSVTLSSKNSILSISLTETAENNPTGILDFGGYATNRLDLVSALASSGFSSSPASDPDTGIAFKINGVSFSFSSDDSVSKIMNGINSSSAGIKVSYSQLEDKFTLVSDDTGVASSVSFEDTAGSLMNSMFGTGVLKSGTDAVIKLNMYGSSEPSDQITVTRSTNAFDLNGSTVKLLGKAAGDTAENISIGLNYDVDSIADKISSFISDYNELLGSLTTLTSEKVYKDYDPLTDDEKEKLSENEIKTWTEQAKSGTLRNDTYLTSIETDLRSSMYSTISGLGSLSSIGITTGLYSEKGKLYIDKDKLRAALSKDAEGTLEMFTKESDISYSLYSTPEQQETRFNENGVLSRISDIIKKNLSNVGKKGALITLVGSPDSSYNAETEYSKRINALDTKIDFMEEKLTSEEDRYWRQFTTMESAIAKMNSQSSYITQLFSSNKN
ncbi:MAG: flagellar filament capping protein FliD [Oscillospiraceae bacterium]|nr:flagellar filament capping protein FliD [Oscillospiraceae bacterium]